MTRLLFILYFCVQLLSEIHLFTYWATPSYQCMIFLPKERIHPHPIQNTFIETETIAVKMSPYLYKQDLHKNEIFIR